MCDYLWWLRLPAGPIRLNYVPCLCPVRRMKCHRDSLPSRRPDVVGDPATICSLSIHLFIMARKKEEINTKKWMGGKLVFILFFYLSIGNRRFRLSCRWYVDDDCRAGNESSRPQMDDPIAGQQPAKGWCCPAISFQLHGHILIINQNKEIRKCVLPDEN